MLVAYSRGLLADILSHSSVIIINIIMFVYYEVDKTQLIEKKRKMNNQYECL